ncbi:MAG: Crp/Fnr family transcriptional regulator [Acidimicrobiales bacterium]
MVAEANTFMDRLTEPQRAALVARGRNRRYRRGAFVFHEGDPGHEVIIVCEGHVKVALTSPGGREVVLEVCGPGELLGELSAIDGGTRSASASALEPCTALLVSHREFLAFVDEHQGVATTLLLLLAERLRGTSLRQLEFGTNDAIGRVCARLVDMAGRYGTERDDGAVTLRMPVAQHDLAAWSGQSREAVVKAFRALRTLGWIDVDGRDVVVHDVETLRARSRSA